MFFQEVPFDLTRVPALQFRQSDGKVYLTNTHWEPTILVARDILDNGDPDAIALEGDQLRITVANGWAVYRLVDLQTGLFLGKLLDCALQFQAPPAIHAVRPQIHPLW